MSPVFLWQDNNSGDKPLLTFNGDGSGVTSQGLQQAFALRDIFSYRSGGIEIVTGYPGALGVSNYASGTYCPDSDLTYFNRRHSVLLSEQNNLTAFLGATASISAGNLVFNYGGARLTRRTETLRFDMMGTVYHVVGMMPVVATCPGGGSRFVYGIASHFYDRGSIYASQTIAYELVCYDRQNDTIRSAVAVEFNPDQTRKTRYLNLYDNVSGLWVSGDGARLFVLVYATDFSSDAAIVVLDATTFSVLSTNTIVGTNFGLMALSPNGARAYTTRNGSQLYVYETTNWTIVDTWNIGFSFDQRAIVADLDGEAVYVASDTQCKAFAVATGSLLATTARLGGSTTAQAAVSVNFAICRDFTDAIWTAKPVASDAQLYRTRLGAAARETMPVITGCKPVSMFQNARGDIFVFGLKAGGDYKLWRSQKYGAAGSFTEMATAAFSSSTYTKPDAVNGFDAGVVAIAIEIATNKLWFSISRDDGTTWGTPVLVATLTASVQFRIRQKNTGELVASTSDQGIVYKSLDTGTTWAAA